MATRWHPAWIGLLGALLYLPTLGYGLTRYDDPWLLRDNVLLQALDWDRIAKVLFDLSVPTRLPLGAEYLPVRDLSVMLDFAVWGDWFGGHHLTQLALYGGVCALSATLVLELFASRRLAWWVGAAFAAHPIHVEAVCWLSERKGVLGAFLFFGAACLGVRYLRRGSAARLIACFVLLAASALAKGHMLAGGGALAMCALWVDAPKGRRWTLGIGSLGAAGLAFMPVYLAGQSVGMVQAYHGGGLAETLKLFTVVHGKYLQLMLLGGPYSVAYPVGLPQWDATHWSLGAAGAAGLLAFAVVAVRAAFRPRRRGPASFGLGWWLLFLAPVSHLVFPLQNLLADRYLFVAGWGLLLVLGAALVRLPVRSGRIVGACWLVASIVWTVTQTGHWESSHALRAHAVQVHPGHVDSWSRLASQAEEERDYALAARYIDLGLANAGESEDRWRLFHRRALLFHAQGRLDDAIHWMRVAASRPEAHKAYANLGYMLAARGEIEEALSFVRQAVEYEPRSAHNQRTRGIVALEAGEVDEARRAFDIAALLEPYNPDSHFNIGVCALRQGDRSGSDAAFRRALELQPSLRGRVDSAREAAAP